MARAIADQLQLGECSVTYEFFDFRAAFAAFDVVPAGAAGIQARRIGCGEFDWAYAFFRYCSTVESSSC
jgi:hypothetical protein